MTKQLRTKRQWLREAFGIVLYRSKWFDTKYLTSRQIKVMCSRKELENNLSLVKKDIHTTTPDSLKMLIAGLVLKVTHFLVKLLRPKSLSLSSYKGDCLGSS